MKPARYLVTAALPYANGPKHIGHLAGAYIPADVYVRYQRLRKRDILFVCGSDEHGTAIPNQALKENTTPQAIIDKYHALIKDCFLKLGMSFDIYHRTSDPLHHQTAQEFFLTLYEKGLLQEETSEQYFDEKANVFLADRYITGICPKCNYDHAYGDQCERCGSSLSSGELKEPRSVLSGNPPVLRATKHWYLPLQHYEKWLSEWILEKHKDDWKPNVYGQCKSWIDSGLQPRAMTRDLDWGIKVPLPKAEGKVLYVWFDAPVGYISATRAFFDEMASGQKKYAMPQRDFGAVKADDWKKYWCEDDTQLVHFIGKDNIVFHCIIFPVMLRSSEQYILPQNVPANEFMNLEGDKMSTSRGWSVEMHDYLHEFPDKPDVLRYALLANLPEAKDSEFTWKDFQAKNNNELAAIFGNFINRTLTLTAKHFRGQVPTANYNEADKKTEEAIKTFPERIGAAIEAYRFREATALFIDLARTGNKYLTENEPWKLSADLERMGSVLNMALQISAALAVVSEPFLPFSSQKLKEMLRLKPVSWEEASTPLLQAGHALGESKLLFEKIEDSAIEGQIQKLLKIKNALKPAENIAAPKDEVTFDEFAKMDIRIGQILSAERAEKSKKILKLQVDIGLDVRTVMSGIAEHYAPEELTGKQVALMLNLVPRKIMGVESQGMLLMVSEPNGKLRLLQPSEIVAIGSTVK